MAQIGVTVADIINGSRALTGIEKTKQATNDQLGSWANEGLGSLYDAVIQADESYFSLDADLTFGTGTQAAATQPLPADFYHMRGVKHWPDTSRQHPVFPVAETDASRKIGYILRGKTIQVTPAWANTMAGPYRISYAPAPPRFGRVLNLSVAADDGIVTGGATGFPVALSARYGNFTADDGATNSTTLMLYNSLNDSRNIIGTFPAVGGIPTGWSGSPSSPTTTRELLGLTQESSVPVLETFAPDTIAVLVHTGEIVTLDSVLAPYKHYIECYVAAKVLEKKKQSTDDMVRQMNAEIARFVAALPDRESEPEAAPVLWRPRGPYGGGSCSGGYGGTF